MPLRRRDRIQTIVNSVNTILFEGEEVSIDKLDSLVMAYYLNDGKEEDRPTKFSYAELNVDWDKRASQEIVENVIYEMALGYTSALKSIYSNSDECSICDTINENKIEFQRKYPFYLSVTFGRELRSNRRLPIPVPPPPLAQFNE
jgi:hypothetical protein